MTQPDQGPEVKSRTMKTTQIVDFETMQVDGSQESATCAQLPNLPVQLAIIEGSIVSTSDRFPLLLPVLGRRGWRFAYNLVYLVLG